MNIDEAIIIAGGLGTRLKDVVKDVPKPMVDINGVPFLEYLISQLSLHNVQKVILAIGYKSDIIQNYFDNHPSKAKIIYSVENGPLGTGGAIKKAFDSVDGKQAIVVNGDTYFDFPVPKLIETHAARNSDITMALKKMADCDRYGTVILDGADRIIGFEPGQHIKEGYVNSGYYVINEGVLDKAPEVFSFEADFLARYFREFQFFGCPVEGYFIDIGVPEDLEKARKSERLMAMRRGVSS